LRFEDTLLLATGEASGLGAATARRFADEGAKIVVADIDLAAADELAASLPDALAVMVDTADATSVERARAAAVGDYGQIDVIFNNAGIEGRPQPLHEMTVDNWERVTAVNGDGVFFVLKHGIDAMLGTGGGVVVNTSSTAGLIGQENICAEVVVPGR
jgi:NAD(P)-dependent dehydrogenase (short-subunit alcohol dehydrogenase family)